MIIDLEGKTSNCKVDLVNKTEISKNWIEMYSVISHLK